MTQQAMQLCSKIVHIYDLIVLYYPKSTTKSLHLLLGPPLHNSNTCRMSYKQGLMTES